MQPVIDHIHITAAELARAERFYDELLPLPGFDLAQKSATASPNTSTI